VGFMKSYNSMKE